MADAMEAFNTSDAVLSDDIEQTFTKFLDDGGDLREASEALLESYEGYPDMIRALVDWSDLFGDGTASLESALENVLHENEQTLLVKVDEAVASRGNVVSAIAAISASKRWNPVVTALASKNRDSTLYNHLTRETKLVEAGINQDVLHSPKSFVDAILAQLSDMFSESKPVSNEELLALYKRISAMCTYDECSTVLALGLFHKLSKKAEDPLMFGIYRRLGQEVRKEAVRVMTSASITNESVARHFVVRLAILTDCVTSNVLMRKDIVDALLSMLAKDRTARKRYESETKTLLDCYGRLIGNIGIKDGEVVESVVELNYDTKEKGVLIRSLCHTEVLEDLIKALFSAEYRSSVDGKPDTGKRRCLCLLLSYAAVFIQEDDGYLEERLIDEESKAKFREAIKVMFEKLESIAAICEDLKPGCPRFKIKGKPVQILLDATKDPLIARGVLIWAKEGLHGGSDLRALLVTSRKHLAFLEAIAQYHQVLRDQVLEIISEVFMRDYPGLDINQVEMLRDIFMKSLTCMVRIQMAHQIVHIFLRDWADNSKVDLSHLRKFITALLEAISPPYAESFAMSLLKLLENKRVAAAIDRDAKAANLVLTFREHVKGMGLLV